jgi:flagellin FlaB
MERSVKIRGMTTRIKGIYSDDRGITGLETAIILIAFIVVAAVFAFTVMTTGLFSTEKAKTTAQAGIAEASSTFAPKGAIIAEKYAVGDAIEKVTFQVTLATGASSAAIKPAGLAFIYSDKNQRYSTPGEVAASTGGIVKSIEITKIVGDATKANLLSEGEVAEILVTLNKDNCSNCVPLASNTTFRIELIPPAGGSLILSRKTPPDLQGVMNLE